MDSTHAKTRSIPRHLPEVEEMFDATLCKMHYDLGKDCSPWSVAYFGGIRLGGIDVYRDEGIAFRNASRTRRDIEENPADEFFLAMPLSAMIALAQNGRMTHCGPGSAILFSAAQPFSSTIRATVEGAHYVQYLSKISAAMLRLRVPNIDAMSNSAFDVRSGAGKVLKSLFELALEEGDSFSEIQTVTFSRMLIDAIANVAHALPDGGDKHRAGSSLDKTWRKAIAYIEENLGNPRLDVAKIAQHCEVSQRYLHAAFAAQSTRVGRYVRETRLQECHRALRDDALAHASVTEIALRWGFDDLAHFSRAYKQRFGVSPSQDRIATDHQRRMAKRLS